MSKVSVDCAMSRSGHTVWATAHGLTGTAGTETGARKALAAEIGRTLTEAAARERDPHRTVLGCRDGTVLVVERNGYVICGAGRKAASGAITGETSALALKTAREHAEGSYGGVAWETIA